MSLSISNSTQNIDLKSDAAIKELNTDDSENSSIFEGTSDTENSAYIDKIISALNGSKSGANEFTDLEASVYAKGEAEIEKEAQSRYQRQMLQCNISGTVQTYEEIEEEVRQEYIEENPDYAMVYEEGQQVESDYEAAMDEAEQEFLEENPEPEYSEYEYSEYSMDIAAGMESDEHKEWVQKKEEYMNQKESEYTKNNPEYAKLKESKEEYESDSSGWFSTLKKFLGME